MTSLQELLKQRPIESLNDYATRVFSNDPTGETAEWESHVAEHHKPYLCHCKTTIIQCDEFPDHWNPPLSHKWELVPHPAGGRYMHVMKCPEARA